MTKFNDLVLNKKNRKKVNEYFAVVMAIWTVLAFIISRTQKTNKS